MSLFLTYLLFLYVLVLMTYWLGLLLAVGFGGWSAWFFVRVLRRRLSPGTEQERSALGSTIRWIAILGPCLFIGFLFLIGSSR